jgi:hypothetical protein
MDLILSNGEGLQSVFVPSALNRSPPGPERVRQLGDRKNAFFVVLLAILLAHLREQSKFVPRELSLDGITGLAVETDQIGPERSGNDIDEFVPPR